MQVDPNIIRVRVIVVRPGTETREAIKITVTQKSRGENGELLNPTIQLSGKIDTMIESGRFAHDLGVAFVIASHYHEEWSKYVTGKR